MLLECYFYLRLFQDRCTISFNSSGEHLHKRGYRSFVSKAPLRETLAAALLLSARAKPFETVIDPMCGSGTLLIEEALLAKKQAPGLVRPFAFEHLPAFHASKWERFKTEASTQALELNKRLIGIDIESKNIESARTNATRAGIKTIQFLQADALSTVIEALNPESTLLVSNLPYGERLNTDTRALLAEFAIHLNQNYQGCSFAFIAKDKAWLESTHFELAACQHFQNGGLDVFLLMGKIKGRGLQP